MLLEIVGLNHITPITSGKCEFEIILVEKTILYENMYGHAFICMFIINFQIAIQLQSPVLRLHVFMWRVKLKNA